MPFPFAARQNPCGPLGLGADIFVVALAVLVGCSGRFGDTGPIGSAGGGDASTTPPGNTPPGNTPPGNTPPGNTPPGVDGGNGPGPVGGPMTGSFSAPFLWQPISFAGAVDLGFAAGPVPDSEQVAAGPVQLAEVGSAAGLGDSVAGGNPHGVGVGFFDVDNDTYDDIFLIANRTSALYRNRGDGTFEDVSASSGVSAILGSSDGYSIAAADYDRDGDLDAYVTAHPNDFLLRNRGDGTFEDVTDAVGAGGPNSSQPGSASKIAAFGDFDNDGLLDVVVASSTFSSQPENGYLLRNRGDGTFEDVTDRSGLQISNQGNPCAVMWSDYDNDGDQDLWVWNDRGNSQSNRTLLRNDGGTFTDVTQGARIDQPVGNPMGIDGADIDHDGDLDYYVSDIGGNELMLNNGDGTFDEIANRANARGEYGWGLGFEDLNADSWADIFVAQEDDMDYLTFTNQGTSEPSFVEARWSHSRVGNGHNVGVAFADFDHDGTIDIVTASTSGSRMNLYRNDTNLGSNRWLEVRVPVTPGTGERGGISGRVVVHTGDVVQFRDITGGSSRASQNAMSVRFGLGQYTGADWVGVLWPDGRQSVVLNVEGNRVLEMPAP